MTPMTCQEEPHAGGMRRANTLELECAAIPVTLTLGLLVKLMLPVLLVSRVQLFSDRSVDELIKRDALAVCASGRTPVNILCQRQIK